MVSILDTPAGDLAFYTFGEGRARFLGLHGFTLGGRSFGPIAERLTGAMIAPDLPGHGVSTVDPINLEGAMLSLEALLSEFALPPLLVGYSQGGRIAAQLAVRRPDLMSGLVMLSASAGISDEERQQRIAADETMADKIEDMGVESFINWWLTNPILALDDMADDERTADLAIRMENTAAGLAAAMRGLGQGALPRIDPSDFGVPTLWLAGSRDEKYVERMSHDAELAGSAMVVVEDAGHNILAERPDHVCELINSWALGCVRAG